MGSQSDEHVSDQKITGPSRKICASKVTQKSVLFLFVYLIYSNNFLHCMNLDDCVVR